MKFMQSDKTHSVRSLLTIAFIFLVHLAWGQYSITGKVSDQTQRPLSSVEIYLMPNSSQHFANSDGSFEIKGLSAGNYELIFLLENYETIQRQIDLDQDVQLSIEMKKLEIELNEVVVAAEAEKQFGLRKLRAVEGTAIYAGKKTEVVLLNQLTVNAAANNARQIYAQIAGLNIYEANDAGLQLNIGGRGLDPNRTANFNTRQNGYDISADVLGYPESYYSPPAEALREIQVIRGAASLQYGTQFGGLVNFRFKKPNAQKKIEWTTRQTLGSNALFTSFNSLSGTIGKFSYYSYFNYKQGKDFRPNSKFDSSNFFAHLNYQFSENTSLNFEVTYLKYLAQQAGGLTDAQFLSNPNFSNRTRNWFEVDWRLWASKFKHKFSAKTDLSVLVFGLNAKRQAVGFRTNRVSQNDDLDAPRDLLVGSFQNWGSEVRFLHRYKITNKDAVLLVGSKFYKSTNEGIQGAGSTESDANFTLQNDRYPAYPNQSDFDFPNFNLALFGEHIFYINDKFSITPGFRLEHIKTESIGTYRAIDFDLAMNPIRDTLLVDNRTFQRNRLLLGLGLSYKPKVGGELYSNFSQNYRSVTFSDIRTVNPSFQVDPAIKDENGFNADLGFRGKINNFSFDLTVFGLQYNDRLGEVLRPQTRVNAEGQTVETGRIIRFRGNIGNAFIYGFEGLADWNVVQPDLDKSQYFKLNIFTNLALTRSIYLSSEIAGVEGKEVEFIPLVNLKTGIGFGYKNFLGSFQYTYLSEQFTDASNAPQEIEDNQSGIVGSIPRYGITDLSLSYRYKRFKLEVGSNNLFNNSYFTRRATGYPGPGIIPAAPMTVYTTLEVKI